MILRIRQRLGTHLELDGELQSLAAEGLHGERAAIQTRRGIPRHGDRHPHRAEPVLRQVQPAGVGGRGIIKAVTDELLRHDDTVALDERGAHIAHEAPPHGSGGDASRGRDEIAGLETKLLLAFRAPHDELPVDTLVAPGGRPPGPHRLVADGILGRDALDARETSMEARGRRGIQCRGPRLPIVDVPVQGGPLGDEGSCGQQHGKAGNRLVHVSSQLLFFRLFRLTSPEEDRW